MLTTQANNLLTLRAIMWDIVDSSDAVTPRAIAEKILASLDPDDYVWVLGETLPEWVRVEMNRAGLRSPVTAAAPEPFVAETGERFDSPKRAAIVQRSRALLEVSIEVGPGVRKRLGDCTADEVRWHADMLYGQARKIEAKADWFGRVASAIPPGGVVRDIPPAAWNALG